MRVLLLACVLGLLLSVPASAPAASKYKDCGNISDMVGAVKAKKISCKKALEIAAAHSEGAKKPAGFKCRVKRYEGGATWTCRKNAKRIKYSRAD